VSYRRSSLRSCRISCSPATVYTSMFSCFFVSRSSVSHLYLRCRLLLLVDIPSVAVPVVIVIVGILCFSTHCVLPHVPVVRCPGSQLRLSTFVSSCCLCWIVGLLVLRSLVSIALWFDGKWFS
jgi:hypothetical protein